MKKLILASLSAALLVGCGQPLQRGTTLPDQSAPSYQAGELNQESVYDLLLAEIAGQRQQFDQALALYLKQARLTGDAGVAERATRVAQYLRQPDAMAEAAELWRQAAPDNPEPYQVLTSLKLHQGRFDEALPLLEKALADNGERMLLILRSQLHNMDPQTLTGYLQLLDQIELQDPIQRSTQLITRGALLIQLQRHEEALQTFDGVLAADPENLDALTQKAELLRSTGRVEEALQLLRGPTLTLDLENNRQLHILYTQLLFQAGDIGAGSEQARALLETLPGDLQLKFYLGLLLLEYDQRQAAAQLMRELLADRPSDTRPYYYLGHIAQKEGRTEDALTAFLQVRDGKNILQAHSRALTLLDAPDHQPRVQQILQDARAQMPAMAPQLYALEAEWLNLHDFTDDALTVLNEALGLYGDDTSLLYSRAMLLEGTNYALAERDLRRILALEPDNAMALNALGYTMTLHTGRYQEAYALISRALALRPDDAAVVDSMGWVLFKLKRYTEAVEYLERAYAEVADAEVAGHLIRAYWAAGERARARELLAESLLRDPDSEHLREAAQAIGGTP